MNQKKNTKKEAPQKKGVDDASRGGAYCTHPGCGWTGSIPGAIEHQKKTGHPVDY